MTSLFGKVRNVLSTLPAALVCEASPIASENSHGQRMKRDVVRTPTLADRVNCGPGDVSVLDFLYKLC